MDNIEALVARVAPLIEAVDLDNDVDDALASSLANAKESGTILPENVQMLWVLNHRRDITVQENRQLLRIEIINSRAHVDGGQPTS